MACLNRTEICKVTKEYFEKESDIKVISNLV